MARLVRNVEMLLQTNVYLFWRKLEFMKIALESGRNLRDLYGFSLDFLEVNKKARASDRA